MKVAFLLVELTVLVAIVGAATEAEEAAPDFGLVGPEISKLGWSTRALVAADIDGDGRTDLAALNNDRARIDLLYQRAPGEQDENPGRLVADRWEPELEDAPFRKRSVSTGIKMYALAVGDLDGDGSNDLVYTGSPEELTVRYQTAPGDFSKRRVLEVGGPVTYISSLAINDLDGDGQNDLALLTSQKLLVFTQGRKHRLEGPRTHALSSDSCDALRVMDANGDGITDISYQVAKDPDRLRLRFGAEDGSFGPEHAFRLDIPGGVLQPLRLAGDDTPAFVRVQRDTGIIEVLRLREVDRQDRLLKDVRPRVFSAQVDSKTGAAYAVGDLDNNQLLDLAIADPKGAQIRILLQNSSGVFGEDQAFPALADVRSVAAADLDGDGAADLIMASPKERTVARASLTDKGRLHYPRPLPTVGKPWAVVAEDLDGDGRVEVAFSFEDKKERGVAILDRQADSEQWQRQTIILDDLNSTPRGLKVLDADQDGRTDLAVLSARDPVRFLLQAEDGHFTAADLDGAFRKGLVNDVEPAALSGGDVDGDGQAEILVANTGFARALTLKGGKNLEVVDQFNARSADTRVAAAVVADVNGDSVVEVLLLEKNGGAIDVLTRRPNGVYEVKETVPLGTIDVVETRVLDLDGNGLPDLLIFGTDRFFWLPMGTSDLQLEAVSSFESDLKGVTHRLLGVGDLNDDSQHDLVAVDSRDSRVLEILTADGENGWHSAMHFTVFEVDSHYQGQRGNTTEPSEIVIADLDNDQRDDLALLTHDRVLVYFQSP